MLASHGPVVLRPRRVPSWLVERSAHSHGHRLPEEQVPIVAEVLAGVADQVRALAPDVLADTVRTVHGP